MKTKPASKAKSKTVKAESQARALARHFLKSAARETQRMQEHSEDCNYAAAAEADTRRYVWLMASLIAQEWDSREGGK